MEDAVYGDSDVVQTFHKDMGLTPKEFAAALPNAVRGDIAQTDASDLSFYIKDDERSVFIICEPLENRKIGSLSLPRLKVEIKLSHFDKAKTDSFLDKFNLAYFRMGG